MCEFPNLVQYFANHVRDSLWEKFCLNFSKQNSIISLFKKRKMIHIRSVDRRSSATIFRMPYRNSRG